MGDIGVQVIGFHFLKIVSRGAAEVLLLSYFRIVSKIK